ncbi:MAG: serine/threonine-protein kinase [Planctomycetota bacterium]
MLEPPSAPLLKLLRELRLCTPADLRRCRARVRRMATDLPAFDSVWIDALVQLRRLTPFQAQILESPHPERLRVGPCVLVERLAVGFSGATYLARAIGTRQARILKLVTVEEDLVPEIMNRSQKLMTTGRKLAHPSIVIPQACERIEQQLVFVSRHIPGRTLTELLIRRGRYPARVVWQIGRQLADGLARLHAIGLAHGEIRPSQVRLLSEGTAVLIDTGIQGVLEPELTPHSQLVPECYDCIAPELIGTGITCNPASDLYALGCLLWQLLAGRPPFPGGDPLVKLASHQTRRIRDVRDFAPDTPAPLAEMILKLTSPNVADRPANAGAVLQTWGAPRRSGRRLLKRFVSSFERPVGEGLKLASVVNSPLVWTLTLLFAITGITAGFVHEGTRANLLRIWAAIPHVVQAPSPATVATNSDSATVEHQAAHITTTPETPLQKIPEPNAQGIIELATNGPYAPRDITQIGPLVIRSRQGIRAEIVLDETPLVLLAEKIQLQGLVFRRANTLEANGESPAPPAQLLVEALELEVRDTSFLTHSDTAAPVVEALEFQTRQATPSAICWRVPDAAGPRTGMAVLENVVVLGTSSALDLRSPARKITLRNVLRLGAGPLLHLGGPRTSPLDLELQLEHVTCRQSGSLVRWVVLDQKPAKEQIKIDARDCVFEILPTQGGLLEFVGQKHVADWAKRIKFVGDICLASEQTEIMVRSSPTNDEFIPGDSSDIALEGITQGGFAFVGAFTLQPRDSTIQQDFEGIRSSRGLPGVISTRLPGGTEHEPPILAASPPIPARAPAPRRSASGPAPRSVNR